MWSTCVAVVGRFLILTDKVSVLRAYKSGECLVSPLFYMRLACSAISLLWFLFEGVETVTLC